MCSLEACLKSLGEAELDQIKIDAKGKTCIKIKINLKNNKLVIKIQKV